MADPKLRLVALTVLGGALHGRRHNPDEVVTEILIGSDPDCHLVVDLPGVSPIHARIWADLDQSVVYETRAPRGLYVNTDRVEGQASIDEGDVLWLGPPQEPDSVCVQLHFEPWVEHLPPAGPALWDAPAEPSSTPELAPAESAPVEPAPVEPVPPVPDDATAATDLPREVVPPEPAPSGAAPAEEDPFFVGGEAEVPEAEPTPIVTAEPPPVRPSPPPVSLPSPEELVAETVADDWAIADAVPAGAPPAFAPPPIAASRPPAPAAPPPAAAVPADDFFVAEEPRGEDAEILEAEPLLAEPLVAEPVAPESLPPMELPSLEPPPPEPPSPPTAHPAPPAPVPPAPIPPSPTPKEPSRPAPRRSAPATAPRPAAARRPGPAARPARRPSGGAPAWLRPVALGAGALLVLGALGFFALRFFGGGVRLQAVEPSRVRVGQRATLTGTGFAAEPGGNKVLFDGREAKVQAASPTRLEVEVPEAVAESGGEKRVAVVVRRGDRESPPVEVAVFQGPRLHGISPEAALPGEEVVLAGAGWGPGATVRFGAANAQVNEVQSTRIRAVVPEAAGSPGTAAPVVVTVGGVDSNAAPFIVGRLPLVTSATPAKASPGDVVEVSGRGFQGDPLRNDVRIGGVPALVLESRGEELKVVVPRLPAGELTRRLEVRVPGSEAVGQATLEVDPPADPVPFRFVAEPFTAVPGRPHAVLSTGLGPAFVVAAASGKTAAARAVEAAGRLNAAGEALRTTVGLNLEARGSSDATPVIALPGRPDALLEVTPEDAAAYDEDWSGLKGRGGKVTPARLARWWEAVGRDIVLLTVRGEKPQHAAALAPEGRVLVQLFEAAQRTGRPGVPRQVVDEARPALRDGLRLLALRVPASVTPPAAAAALAPVAAATPAPARLQLEGTWTGSQVEQGQRQYLTVAFQRGGGGSIAFEGGITFTVPLLSLTQPRRDQARFSVQIRGGVRHYTGTWDGEKLAGSISTDAAGKNAVATFELRRR